MSSSELLSRNNAEPIQRLLRGHLTELTELDYDECK